jgi:hypothetical protein
VSERPNAAAAPHTTANTGTAYPATDPGATNPADASAADPGAHASAADAGAHAGADCPPDLQCLPQLWPGLVLRTLSRRNPAVVYVVLR